jgi:hypothetical protein
MGPFEMVVAIVLIATVGSIIRAKNGIARDRKGNEFFRQTSSGETEALQAEIRLLKDRIQVLERIATDNNRAVSLDAEIERLRDPAPR